MLSNTERKIPICYCIDRTSKKKIKKTNSVILKTGDRDV